MIYRFRRNYIGDLLTYTPLHHWQVTATGSVFDKQGRAALKEQARKGEPVPITQHDLDNMKRGYGDIYIPELTSSFLRDCKPTVSLGVVPHCALKWATFHSFIAGGIESAQLLHDRSYPGSIGACWVFVGYDRNAELLRRYNEIRKVQNRLDRISARC